MTDTEAAEMLAKIAQEMCWNEPYMSAQWWEAFVKTINRLQSHSTYNTKVEANKIETVINMFKSQTYVCSICGKIIFPTVSVNDEDEIEVTSEKCEACGGFTNKTLLGNICVECKRNIGL